MLLGGGELVQDAGDGSGATVSSASDEVSLDGGLPVHRGDFGLTWNFIGIASMHNTIAIHAVFTRAA